MSSQSALTLTEIFPSSFGRCAAKNQSPGRGLVTLNTPVVRLGSVHVSVTAKDPGTMVSFGKRVFKGLMTGGAPDLKYLQTRKDTFNIRRSIDRKRGRIICVISHRCLVLSKVDEIIAVLVLLLFS